MAPEQDDPHLQEEMLVPGANGEPDRWDRHDNPADPGLSAAPGREKHSYLVPASIVAGVALVAIVLFIAMPKGPIPPHLPFENVELGCRFEYPSALIKGPNYVKTADGSILTIERHSLVLPLKADPVFVAGLPDSLFDQTLIQIQENYAYVTETSRTHLTVGGKKAIEVVMEGLPGNHPPKSAITVDIFANEEWVWILRWYSPLGRDAQERPLFRHVLDTFKIIASPSPEKAS